ncbi:MAG: hypothetical protein SV253_02590 [Halobacteria archaeon]|nr:hypothetical protein [Halobacteria archaeon]
METERQNQTGFDWLSLDDDEEVNKEVSRRTQESEDSDTKDEMTRQILEEIRRTRKAVESIDEKL